MPDEITTPAVNEHGYPDATPVTEMAAEHQAAYWKYQSRKHEQRASQAPDAAELEQLRAAAAELTAHKAGQLSDAERLQAEKAAETDKRTAAERERDEARAEALRLRVAAEKALTPAQADRLRGSTREELEADADELLSLFPASSMSPAPVARAGGPRGVDVGASASTASGAERYRAKHGKN
ncbi:hypothetical protein OG709_29835 [Streptomyces sp. NBC_01267]|uniref:hypothetical protein n=1 Tax=Streptomyces sp. NBC_01267 TaxID=2903805 RepID=UPI002E361B51|nr:hypothetical protein [Streptomyces sp. NBC_01267]